ncbi:hypothetical protein BRD08_05550 [Halobacteriales archaeon SW_10_66_29]|nr:MAG: hypothetical protein BRD08_05550 [Halobacteriales archaeon SW_10_66_29]
MRRNPNAFTDDQRAIEGLPIRLVIALVVGVAAMSLMMNMLSTFDNFGDTEVETEHDQNLVTPDGGSYDDVTISVVTEDGDPVEDANILIRSGSLTLEDGPIDLHTGENSNEATLSFGSGDDAASPDFRADQVRGTLEVEVHPPTDSDYVDEDDNREITVVEG